MNALIAKQTYVGNEVEFWEVFLLIKHKSAPNKIIQN